MFKKSLAYLSTAVMVLTLLAACGEKPTPSSSTSSAVSSVVSSAPEGPRTITDMAGREVTIPAEINKVFPSSSNDGIFMYTFAPEKLMGWNYELNELEKKMVLPEYQTLPIYGMGEKINLEAVLADAPDICLQTAKLGGDGAVAAADKLQEQLGVPVVVVSIELLDSPAAYRFLGEVLGVEAAAEERAAYAEKVLDAAATADIPADKIMTAYYGNGPDSLETAPVGSPSAQAMELPGLKNVAEIELGEGSRVEVTLEQVLTWNPDIMFVNGEPKKDISGAAAAKAILEDPAYAEVQAVKDGKVYGIPKSPFSWMDRPQGPNRLIGVLWAAKLAYPDIYMYDIDTEVQEFYKLFYHVDLTAEQLAVLYTD